MTKRGMKRRIVLILVVAVYLVGMQITACIAPKVDAWHWRVKARYAEELFEREACESIAHDVQRDGVTAGVAVIALAWPIAAPVAVLADVILAYQNPIGDFCEKLFICNW